MISYFKQKTYRSKEYLTHVRTFPCVVCGNIQTESHHVRHAFNSGTGIKPSDYWAISLCPDHHREIHQSGIKTFQEKYDVNIYRELFLIAKAWIEKH